MLNLDKKLESDGFVIRNYGQEKELIKKIKNLITSSVKVVDNKNSNDSVLFSGKRRFCYREEDSMSVSVNG